MIVPPFTRHKEVRGPIVLGGSSSVGVPQAEATAYFEAITAAGSSISFTQQTAVNTFVSAAKAHGYWTKLLDVGTFTGADLTGARVKLKVAAGTPTSLANTGFVVGDYSPSLGVIGGTGKRFDTEWNYATYGSPVFGHSIYLNDEVVDTAPYYLMGHSNGATEYAQLYLYGLGTSPSYPSGNFNGVNISISRGAGTGRGLYHLYSGSTSSFKARYNGTLFQSTTTATPSAQPNVTCCVGGTVDGSLPKRFSFYAIDDGSLSDAEATAFANDVKQLMLDLGRVVKSTGKLRYAFIVGQSLAEGTAGSPPLSTTQPYANKSFPQNEYSAVSSIMPYYVFFNLVPYVEIQRETPAAGFANFQSALWRADHPGDASKDLLLSKYGVGGASIAYIGKGGTLGYADSMTSVSGAISISPDYFTAGTIVPGIISVHGETDGASATYQADIEDFQADYDGDIKAITGQTETVVMFHSQPSFWGSEWGTTIKSPLAILAAYEADPTKHILVCPKYRLPYADGIHLTNDSYRWLGEMYAKAWDKAINRGTAWSPLRPSSISRTGAVITVTFTGNVGNIQFDTTSVTDPNTKKGFEYTDDSSPPAISTVAITGANTLTVTLASTPTGANKTLKYAMTSYGGSGDRGGPTTGPRGCLCDSDTTVSPNGYDLRNWCVHFSQMFEASGSGGSDTEAADFFTRAGITDATQQSAVNQLVLALKSAGIWTKMKALYPFVGGTAGTHSHNLASSSYQITWSGSVTHDANGITGAGGGGDTGLDALSLNPLSVAFGVYSRSAGASDQTDVSGGAMQYALYTRYVSDNTFICIGVNGGWISPLPTTTDARGFFVAVRQTVSLIKVLKNGSELSADAANTVNPLALTAGNFLLLGASLHNHALAFISDGLTDAEITSFNTAVQTFQTTLGRNV